jgi:acyl-CoA thioester hydrolase
MDSLRPVIHTTGIRPEWLDYNDHLNEAYYLLIFDQADEVLLQSLGLGEETARATGISWVVLENHITYNHEITPGDIVDVHMQLLDYDQKRLHLYFEMHVKGGTGNPASTLEQMLMCVDLKKRRSTRFPGHVQAEIQSLFRSHADLPQPGNLGRRIGIRRDNR